MMNEVAVAAVIYLVGAILAGNIGTAATVTGNYLIGRRRFRFTKLPHRRETMTRVVGCLLCLAAAQSAVRSLAGGTQPAWMDALAALGGLVPPAVLWWLTANNHGANEVPDSEGTRDLFGTGEK